MQSKQSLVLSNAYVLYCAWNLNCDHLKYADASPPPPPLETRENYGRKQTLTLCNAALIGKRKQFTEVLKPVSFILISDQLIV